MSQYIKLLSSLSLKQRFSIGVVAVLVLLGIYRFSTWRKDSDFKPLYTGVAAQDAGTIIQKIKESGVEYHLSDSGGVISVPSASVAELRLQLASLGLPKSGRIGFELFDKTNFGATEFVEHINYGRALEGELERSVSSLAAIEESRIHITPSKDSLFVESREAAKASVVLKLRTGAALSFQNVMAIQQLVASAVEGLTAEGVSVVDSGGSLLSHKKMSPEEEASDGAYAHRQLIERTLLEKINTTLDPLLGRDKYRAGVSVDCDITSGEQNDETLDPTKSVMTSSQKTEEVTNGATSGGVPGTATNLPKPPVRTGGSGATTTRRTENVSYVTSHLVRRTLLPQGAIKRVSVAVLLDQRVRWEGKGSQAKAIFIPPSPETIKAIHDVIAGLTGFTEERGDNITIESAPFESTADQAPPSAGGPAGSPAPQKVTGWREKLLEPTSLIAAGIGAAVVLILALGVFFVRRTRTKAPGAVLVEEKAIGAASLTQALPGATGTEKLKAALAERQAEQEAADLNLLAGLRLPPVTSRKTELLVTELRETTKKDPAVPAQVLQTWIRGNE